jgi:hypothetical protein
MSRATAYTNVRPGSAVNGRVDVSKIESPSVNAGTSSQETVRQPESTRKQAQRNLRSGPEQQQTAGRATAAVPPV